eukprot:CAMPEP_0185847144 /NCGR_PEP_ID=MMETSP1354-20130828/2529_1 /TAXON_ID=708628 /ORGANISM="Erythrolobus madagascarensis, Strain CCMP3276" /LENGTH=638 /DNA_ID=CAMNT_0028547403 /DNA_START=174 /DNA_END=2090 /DNA_ORIENTATION=+
MEGEGHGAAAEHLATASAAHAASADSLVRRGSLRQNSKPLLRAPSFKLTLSDMDLAQQYSPASSCGALSPHHRTTASPKHHESIGSQQSAGFAPRRRLCSSSVDNVTAGGHEDRMASNSRAALVTKGSAHISMGGEQQDEEMQRVSTSSPTSPVGESPQRSVFSPRRGSLHPQPYPHQVGGHGPLCRMEGEPNQLLKPLHAKELAFYEALWARDAPDQILWLRDFTPRFHGVVSVASSSAHADLGEIAVPFSPDDVRPHRVGHPAAVSEAVAGLPELETRVLGKSMDPSRRRSSAGTASSSSDRGSRKGELWTLLSGSEGGKAKGLAREARGISPWAKRMREIAGGRGEEDASSGSKPDEARGTTTYVRMQDVNAAFELPCVLDVKMGVRHYDDDAPPEKVAKHIAKSNATTSSTVGIRFAGMQVYCEQSKMYCFYDKYRGRRLKEQELAAELAQFFFNGNELRCDALKAILARLKQLLPFVLKQTEFKFYSSSLLLVYEGLVDKPVPRGKLNDAVLRDCEMEPRGETNLNSEDASSSFSKLLGSDAVSCRCDERSDAAQFLDGVADVRMIDFAHTQPTAGRGRAPHELLGDHQTDLDHAPGDQGYAFGLKNLIAIMTKILDDHDTWRLALKSQQQSS